MDETDIAGRVHCHLCPEVVETTGGFALPEEWALEFGWTATNGIWQCPGHIDLTGVDEATGLIELAEQNPDNPGETHE